MFRIVALVTLLARFAHANYYVIEPTASTVWKAGKQVTIQWEENGQEPLGNKFGKTRVDICTGTTTQQVCHVNVGTFTSGSSPIRVFLPKTALCNDEHFIRFESLEAKDGAGVALLAFSARFRVTGMKQATEGKSKAKNASASGTSSTALARNATVSGVSGSHSHDSMVFVGAHPSTSGSVSGGSGVFSFPITQSSSDPASPVDASALNSGSTRSFAAGAAGLLVIVTALFMALLLAQ